MNIISLKSKALGYIGPRLYRTKCFEEKNENTIPIIKLGYSNFKYLTHSTYNVAYIEICEKRGYFRECRKHENARLYLNSVISDYFRFVSCCHNSEALLYEIDGYLSDDRKINLLLKMGVKNDPMSRIAKFFKNPEHSSVIGIPDSHSNELDKVLVPLLQFLWGEILTYNMCIKYKAGEYQTFNTNRQVATYKLACMLKIEYLIPKTQYVKLVFPDGKEKMGTLMDVAQGISPEKLQDNMRQKIGPMLQKRMSELCLLDLICRQTDHRPGHDGNYNIVFDNNGFANSVEAFDNDAPTSFTLSKKINFVTSARTSPFIGNNDKIVYPYLSAEVIEAINRLCKNDIYQCVGSYLRNMQCQYIWFRVYNLQKAIQRNLCNHTITLLSDQEWTFDTIQNELSFCRDKNIVTYLYAYYTLTY